MAHGHGTWQRARQSHGDVRLQTVHCSSPHTPRACPRATSKWPAPGAGHHQRAVRMRRTNCPLHTQRTAPVRTRRPLRHAMGHARGRSAVSRTDHAVLHLRLQCLRPAMRPTGCGAYVLPVQELQFGVATVRHSAGVRGFRFAAVNAVRQWRRPRTTACRATRLRATRLFGPEFALRISGCRVRPIALKLSHEISDLTDAQSTPNATDTSVQPPQARANARTVAVPNPYRRTE